MSEGDLKSVVAMPAKCLILTVGGSDEPLVSAIKHHRPDFIYFICSRNKPGQPGSSEVVDGPEHVTQKGLCCPHCKNEIKKTEAKPNLISQSGYAGGYQKVEVEDPDCFDEIYRKILNTMDEARGKGYDIIADFTGGTKIMTAALAMSAALDPVCRPFLTVSLRRDLVNAGGACTHVAVNVETARVRQSLDVFDDLVSKSLYHSGCLILEQLLQKGLSAELERQIKAKHRLCRGLALWDGFQYEKAMKYLEGCGQEHHKLLEYLLKLIGKGKRSGYEPVFDLVENARRQADNGFYDNAVSRLYRALELFAQTRLKQLGHDSSHLERTVEKLKDPEKWRRRANHQGVIEIGLKDSYTVLDEEDDPTGKVFVEYRDRLMNILQVRNNSKLAHGDTPITEEGWYAFLSFMERFLAECCASIKVSQEYVTLPTSL